MIDVFTELNETIGAMVAETEELDEYRKELETENVVRLKQVTALLEQNKALKHEVWELGEENELQRDEIERLKRKFRRAENVVDELEEDKLYLAERLEESSANFVAQNEALKMRIVELEDDVANLEDDVMQLEWELDACENELKSS